MPRLPADICISLTKRGGPTHRIEVVRQPAGRRYGGRREGRYSKKVPEATATQVAHRCPNNRRANPAKMAATIVILYPDTQTDIHSVIYAGDFTD